MARLRVSWRTSLTAPQQARNPQSESIARNPYNFRGHSGGDRGGHRGRRLRWSLRTSTQAGSTPMTDDRVSLIEALQKADDGNFLRSLAETVLQIIMEADVDGLVGAGRYERTGERSTYRNGYRERSLDTRLGSLNLKIPKLRTGRYFPG